MSLRINTNIAAMDAYRNLSKTSDSMSDSLEKLSSGYRINKAADDASGLAISQGLTAQINGLTQAASNAQDGISVVQTAEGALGESESILQRMNQLAVQAANTGSEDSDARADAQTEIGQLQDELDRISSSTKFGQQVLLNGSFSGTFQVGADAGDVINISIAASGAGLNASGLGVGNIDLVHSASAAITAIQQAIKTVSTERANLGAYQNRFQHTINNLNTTVENLSSANSQITDTDMASEMVKFTRDQILQQAGTSMLAQANSMPQTVLKLLS